MRAAVLVVLAAVCFGTTGTAVALGAPDASALSVGAARIVLGGALLAALALVPLRDQRRPQPPRPPRPLRRPLAAVAVGALGVVAYQPLFFAGTATSGVAVGTVTALGSAPVLTGVLAWALTGARPTRRWAVATAVAVAGLVVLVVAGGDGGRTGDGNTLLGVAASVGAGASYAVYTLATKRLLEAGWSPTASVGAVFGGAALLALPLLLTSDLRWLADPAPQPAAVAAVLWLGVVTTAVAYVLFSRGLRHLPAATVSTLTLAEPLTAALLGLAVLGEHLGVTQAAGLLLVAAGLAVLSAPGRRRGRAAPEPTLASRVEARR